jgi:hypothetical protein
MRACGDLFIFTKQPAKRDLRGNSRIEKTPSNIEAEHNFAVFLHTECLNGVSLGHITSRVLRFVVRSDRMYSV